MAATARLPKSRRINLRASAAQEGLLRSVAERKGQTMTEFIVESACEAAEREFADENKFRLSPEKWQAFVEALDQPAQVHPRLRRLFAQPSVLEPVDGPHKVKAAINRRNVKSGTRAGQFNP